MDLKNRISEALESLLSEIYEEEGITAGDIHPLQAMLWEAQTAEMALLFVRLIEQNKPR